MPLSPAEHIDATLLKPETTSREVAALCEEAVEYGFASVCVPPRLVAHAGRFLYGSGVAVGTVVGFPCGYEPTSVKVFQTTRALEAGATEIDMVIPLGAAREGRLDQVRDEISAIVTAAEGQLVKVIIECCLFPESTKRRLAQAVIDGGAAYVKTSTGFGAHGARASDVALLVEAGQGRIKVKAAGGIRDWPACDLLLRAGAERVGTSSGGAIMRQWLLQAELSACP